MLRVWSDSVTGEFIAVRGNLNLHLRPQTIARNDEFKVASRVRSAGKAVQIKLRIWYRCAIVARVLYAARNFAYFFPYCQLNGVAFEWLLLLWVDLLELLGINPHLHLLSSISRRDISEVHASIWPNLLTSDFRPKFHAYLAGVFRNQFMNSALSVDKDGDSKR